MSKIEAGPELDMAVAEAIGENATIYYNHELAKNICLLVPSEMAFEPSTDLNAAFEAAEKVGLFTGALVYVGRKECGDWVVNRVPSHDSLAVQKYGVDDTPALAICAAILELKRG